MTPSPSHHPRTRVRASFAAALTAALTGSIAVVATAGSAQAATSVVQAETYAAQSGVQVETTADTGGGQNLSYLANGDWTRYDGIDLGATGPLTVSARVSSAGRLRRRRTTHRVGDRPAARPVPDHRDRRLAELGHPDRDGRHPPGRRAIGVRGPEEHPGR
jgi:hypothetical protein